MIHNKKECGAAKKAEKFGVPHCYISHKNEDQIIQLMKAWRVDLIVLAGYMRVVSPDFIKAFPNRIINLHPSLLPKYKGLHAVEQALEAGDKVTGCTVHYVNEELDAGEVILQYEVPIEPDDTVETLTPKIQRKEYALLPAAIQQVKQQIPVATH
tara:strand:+ start:1931 stop:2395 length:465 start_codon:yes stop_codon:yes gene_type:complete